MKDHEPNRLPTAEGEAKKEDQGSEPGREARGRESNHKQNVRKEAAEVEKESKSIVMSSDTYRGKQLPPGMKVKKRLSAEECAKENGVEQVKAKTRESNSRAEEGKSISKSSIESVRPENTNPTHQDPSKDKNEASDLPLKKSLSKSSAKSGYQASSKDSETSQDQTSECPTPSSDASHTKDQQQEEDDDEVVLVSVKPAAAKSSPVSAVQKTLTTFPGFQPASKIKSQQGDPRGLHNLLSAQLKQKKVSVQNCSLPFKKSSHTPVFFILDCKENCLILQHFALIFHWSNFSNRLFAKSVYWSICLFGSDTWTLLPYLNNS